MMKAILFAVAAGLCWGVGEVFTKSVLNTKQIGPITAITVRSTAALVVLWVVWLVVVGWKGVEPQRLLPTDTGTILKLLLGSGLVAGAGGMLFFYAALSYGEVSRVKPIAFALAPLVAVLLGWVLLHEPMTARKGLGTAMILGGIVLMAGGGS